MTPNLAAIVFDSADAEKLAAFWSAVLDRPVVDGADANYAAVTGEPGLAFMKVPEPKTAKNRMHLDLTVADLAGESDRVLGLGARRQRDFDEDGARWTTFSDPEGNEFDLVQGSPS
jgi:predicted enzyme related to lactoylglutathione lyase